MKGHQHYLEALRHLDDGRSMTAAAHLLAALVVLAATDETNANFPTEDNCWKAAINGDPPESA